MAFFHALPREHVPQWLHGGGIERAMLCGGQSVRVGGRRVLRLRRALRLGFTGLLALHEREPELSVEDAGGRRRW